MRRLLVIITLVLGFIKIEAQTDQEDTILLDFFAQEGIKKDSCVILHGIYAWKNAKSFNTTMTTILAAKYIENGHVELMSYHYGRKWAGDSIIFRDDEKHFINYKIRNMQYLVKANNYIYKIASPLIIRDSICFFYYEKTSKNDGGRCTVIFKKQTRAEGNGFEWSTWKKECPWWMMTY